MQRRFAAMALWALLAGCASQSNVRVGFSGAAGAAPGTSVTGSSVGARFDSGSIAGTLIAAGILAAAWHGSQIERDPQRYAGSVHAAGRPVPPLDEFRRVNEQDCGLPIEDQSANLRCR